MSGIGLRAGWMVPYVGDRPRDVLGLTEAQEAKVSKFIGWTGKDVNGSPVDHFILILDPANAVTPTDFAATPLGTELHSNNGTHSTVYVHKAKSTPAVVGDWEVFTAATAT